MTNGQIPESEWLMGEKLGFRGPWGTTYAPNLRLFVRDLSETDFVLIVRNRNTRPPMPWPSLHAMSDQDLKALFAYLKSLETKGDRAPDYVPPTEEPKTPYFSWEPTRSDSSSLRIENKAPASPVARSAGEAG